MLPGMTTWVHDASLENPHGIHPSYVTCHLNNAPTKLMCFHWKPDSNKVHEADFSGPTAVWTVRPGTLRPTPITGPANKPVVALTYEKAVCC